MRTMGHVENEGLNPPPIAVNISPRQFSDPSLIDYIKDAIESTGMESSKLHVQIKFVHLFECF